MCFFYIIFLAKIKTYFCAKIRPLYIFFCHIFINNFFTFPLPWIIFLFQYILVNSSSIYSYFSFAWEHYQFNCCNYNYLFLLIYSQLIYFTNKTSRALKFMLGFHHGSLEDSVYVSVWSLNINITSHDKKLKVWYLYIWMVCFCDIRSILNQPSICINVEKIFHSLFL